MTVTDHPTRHREVLGLSSHDIVAAAGITYRQLDFWIRAGHVLGDRLNAGTGSGNPRVFSLAERDHVVTLARLVKAGIRIDVAAAALRQTTPDLPTEIRLGHGITVRIEAAP